jgi:hypothetical protein
MSVDVLQGGSAGHCPDQWVKIDDGLPRTGEALGPSSVSNADRRHLSLTGAIPDQFQVNIIISAMMAISIDRGQNSGWLDYLFG